MSKQRVIVRLTGGEDVIVVNANDAKQALVASKAIQSPVRQKIIEQLQSVATMNLDQLAEVLRIPKGLLPHQIRQLKDAGLVVVLPGEEYCLNENKLNQVQYLVNDVFKIKKA